MGCKGSYRPWNDHAEEPSGLKAGCRVRPNANQSHRGGRPALVMARLLEWGAGCGCGCGLWWQLPVYCSYIWAVLGWGRWRQMVRTHARTAGNSQNSIFFGRAPAASSVCEWRPTCRRWANWPNGEGKGRPGPSNETNTAKCRICHSLPLQPRHYAACVRWG